MALFGTYSTRPVDAELVSRWRNYRDGYISIKEELDSWAGHPALNTVATAITRNSILVLSAEVASYISPLTKVVDQGPDKLTIRGE